ncbi:cytochrome C oxidase assembly protein [Muribaculum sp. An289]|uniref:cytochrome d ubiquinol oxidase subunit II n=1 Tax=unclassified Muribaculum TaxID=2622126 RepID=UPI000B382F28|nr:MULTISPECIES: cytochrome d ubiquinol oxidase subunit II [unclassified Muribaculum]OUO38543.1 cytochrome C oxidase assembly protein [Muribaculum sp. An289]OUO44034.1 cytochrome C oxidase assembly protein [Muribaculum sp. An287]
METYVFLQHYWWAVVSLLGAILVFLLFVQGGNSLLFCVGKDDVRKQLVINSTGRKWEFTFTTLVTFGGAFFASFPLFYSTSFGGAYWLWMIILFTFVLQAVSYEFQSKLGNLLGRKTYRIFLVINGVVGPILLGGAVATFFTGSNFIVDKGNLAELSMPVISGWANASHGLDALLNVWNVIFGLAVFFLARILGALYFINNIDSPEIAASSRKVLKIETPLFLVLFLAFFVKILVGEGFAVADDGTVFMEKYKYLNNFLEMPAVAAVFLLGVLLLLSGIIIDGFLGKNRLSGKGIFFSGFGTVLAVFGLLLCAGYNGTAYYPSTADLQSSLTIANSCSSEFTLKTMAYVSILVPFVIAYIAYAWKSINSKKLSAEELEKEEEKY